MAKEVHSMPVSIVIPQLGESVAEGTVSKWLKAVGDRVRKEEPLVEIQTDKINVEIPSPAEGTLQQIVVPEGTTVLVGTEIGILAGVGEASSPKPAAAASASAPAAGAAPAPASPAQGGAPSTPGRPAPGPGREPAPAREFAPAASAVGTASGNGGAQLTEDRSLSPAVRKIMRDQNVGSEEIRRIRGSGVGGRVTRDDLLDYLRTRVAGSPAAAASGTVVREPGPRPAFLGGSISPSAAGPREEVVPFTKVRKLIAEHMVKSKHTAPHVTTFDEVDMTAIVQLRKEWGPRLENDGVKLTFMPFCIKASVFALREYPWVNGTVQGDSIVLRKYYNIGIAVGRDDKGLIVPNIKDCDRKNLAQIARDVNDLAARARSDRLKIEEIEGGTFSITNAGVYGAVNSTPIINFPEVAILGVHKIAERAVIRDGQIVPRHMMNIALSFDHRVIDGELAVKFLRRVSELLERPELLWFYA